MLLRWISELVAKLGLSKNPKMSIWDKNHCYTYNHWGSLTNQPDPPGVYAYWYWNPKRYFSMISRNFWPSEIWESSHPKLRKPPSATIPKYSCQADWSVPQSCHRLPTFQLFPAVRAPGTFGANWRWNGTARRTSRGHSSLEWMGIVPLPGIGFSCGAPGGWFIPHVNLSNDMNYLSACWVESALSLQACHSSTRMIWIQESFCIQIMKGWGTWGVANLPLPRIATWCECLRVHL